LAELRALSDADVLRVFTDVGHEIQWVTAIFLVCDVLDTVAAHARFTMADMIRRGILREDRGWLSAGEVSGTPS
jgi:hypothetical protein